MKKIDKYLLGAVLYIIGWSVTFFVAWLVKEQEPTILEGCILAPGVVETINCAVIKRGDQKYGQGKNSAETDE